MRALAFDIRFQRALRSRERSRGCFTSDLRCLWKLNNINRKCCAEAERTSRGPCFIEATDEARAHSSSLFGVCATSADDSRDGWYAPPLKSGIQGELSGHTFLLSSVAQMFPRAVGHSHWEHRQLPHCSQCSVYEQLFIIHAAIHFGAHCVQQILCCCRSFSIM